MTLSLFILGRDSQLSALEVLSYLSRKGVSCHLKEWNQHLVLLETPTIDAQQAIQDLGGTIKIGVPLQNFQELNITKNKVTFSVSSLKADKNKIVQEFKKFCKEQGIRAIERYGSSRDLTPSQSHHLDIELYVFKETLFHITAVSEPRSYKQRDTNRPAFDPRKGTSIRLAKILVNLAQAQEEICDPFCGTGTILQEALLLGYKVIGVDLSVEEARKNLTWLGETYKNKTKLLEGDARTLTRSLATTECIVTEPYLGPYLKKIPSLAEAQKTSKELQVLYGQFLHEASKIAQKTIIMIVPAFKTQEKKLITCNIEPFLQQNKLRVKQIHPQLRFPIEYAYKKSKIKRFIYVLEKTQ